MIRILLYALLIWFLYNLVFRFIIPLTRTTRQFRQQFREMQKNAEEQARQQQGFNQQQPAQSTSTKPSGDYIDFEEIK